MNKKQCIGLSVALFALLSLSIVFFFFDLHISQSIASENPNFLFLLLAAVGEFPIYIGPILFGLVYGFTLDGKNKRIFAHLVGLVSTYVCLLSLTKRSLEVFVNAQLSLFQSLLVPVAALIMYVLLCIVFKKIERKKLLIIKDIVLMSLILTLVSFAIVEAMKITWGRVRFYALSESYHEFTNFLTINGKFQGLISDEYKSFPSGHTNAATSLVLLSAIPIRYIKKRWVKSLIIASACFYVLLVAISRVGVGAHYASDVLFGFTINIVCTYIIYMIFFKKGWLYVRGD